MAQSNCGRGGRMAPPGSNKRMGMEAGFVPRICRHDTQGPPSIFLAQKTGTLADFPIRHRGRAYSQPSRTLRAADAVARRRAILDRRCARRHGPLAGRDGRMVPIEQKDWTRRRDAAGLPTFASGTSYSVREAEEALFLRPSFIVGG